MVLGHTWQSVVDKSKELFSIDFVPVVRDFTDVFPKDLPRLPLLEKYFCIDMLPGSATLSEAPY